MYSELPAVCMQMVPLVKKSSDVLLEIVRELAESGKSVNIHKFINTSVHTVNIFTLHIIMLYIMHRVYGAFTMETLIATAFGQYSNVQRGEADGITDGASAFFRSSADGSAISSDLLMAVLCKLCTRLFPEWCSFLVMYSKPTLAGAPGRASHQKVRSSQAY